MHTNSIPKHHFDTLFNGLTEDVKIIDSSVIPNNLSLKTA